MEAHARYASARYDSETPSGCGIRPRQFEESTLTDRGVRLAVISEENGYRESSEDFWQ